MRVVDTTISSHRQSSMSLKELNEGFLKRWNLLPYSMHYWYFNVIDPVDNCASSYILARSNTVITFNGQRVDPQPDVYTGVYIDFSGRATEVKQTKITVADGMLQSDDLAFGIKGDKTHFRFRNK